MDQLWYDEFLGSLFYIISDKLFFCGLQSLNMLIQLVEKRFFFGIGIDIEIFDDIVIFIDSLFFN